MEKREADTEVRYDESAVCDRCGQFGAFRIGDHWLCDSCYESSGSCCPEFGADDLWQERETD